jgi:transcriptional regulator with XRE-family HTH domain
MDKNEFAEYIKNLRLSRGLTIKQVELYAGISNSYISMIETGKRDIPSPDVLKKLSKIYKVPYEELMIAAGYLKSDYEITPDSFPEELLNIDEDYILVAKELQEKKISPERLRKIIEILEGK